MATRLNSFFDGGLAPDTDLTLLDPEWDEATDAWQERGWVVWGGTCHTTQPYADYQSDRMTRQADGWNGK